MIIEFVAFLSAQLSFPGDPRSMMTIVRRENGRKCFMISKMNEDEDEDKDDDDDDERTYDHDYDDDDGECSYDDDNDDDDVE